MGLKGARVVFVDVETTGGGKRDRVIEIGVVEIERLLETEPRIVVDQLINPGMAIQWAATRIHGIRDADVRRKPRWAEVAAKVQAALGVAGGDRTGSGGVICAYGASFDHRMLTAEGLELPPIDRWIDPLRLSKRLDAEGPHTLAAACERRRIEKGGHRAAADAMATAHLLVAMLRELSHTGSLPDSVEDLIEWLASPGKKLRAKTVRRMWRIQGGVAGSMWLGGPLDGRRHDEGPWWVISANKAVTYWSAEDAERACRWATGTVVEVGETP